MLLCGETDEHTACIVLPHCFECVAQLLAGWVRAGTTQCLTKNLCAKITFDEGLIQRHILRCKFLEVFLNLLDQRYGAAGRVRNNLSQCQSLRLVVTNQLGDLRTIGNG